MATPPKIPSFRTSFIKDGGPLDGALVVHDVPIFCSCARGELKFSDKWVERAAEHAMREEREHQHLPPLHTRHHERATEFSNAVRSVGMVRVVGARKSFMYGKDRMTMFADLIVTDEGAKQDVLRMRHPYRSVEIFNPSGPPAVNGLALLDHEAPFLTLPMLGVSPPSASESRDAQQDRRGVAGATFSAHRVVDWGGQADAVLASVTQGTRTHLLFKLDDMTTPTQAAAEGSPEARAVEPGEGTATFQAPPPPPPPKPAGATPDPAAPNPAAPAAKPAAKPAAEPAAEAEGDGEVSEEDGGPMREVIDLLQSGGITVADLKAISSLVDAQIAEIQGDDAQQQPQQLQPGMTTPAPAAAPGAAESMQAQPAEHASEPNRIVKMQARIDGLEARDAARDARDARRADVESAMVRFGTRPLPDGFEAKLHAMHESGGAEGFKVYVDTFIETFADLGENVLTADGVQSASAASNMLPEVAAFSTCGPDAERHAVVFSAEWDDLNQRGAMRLSRERYLELNMAKLNFKAVPATPAAPPAQ